MKNSPLDDLSFFKFPSVTPQVVQNIVLLFVLIALTVVLTLVAQRWLNRLHAANDHRNSVRRTVRGGRLAPLTKATLERLLALSSVRKTHKLLANAAAFEEAVARLVEGATAETLSELAELRRMFHLNVMNPNLELVSTRQLLRDLPMRMVVSLGGEKLDLYCSPLEIDERFLYFNLDYDEEIIAPLRMAPEVELIFWRETSGETVFQLRLEELAEREEDVPLFRAPHAFISGELAQRADFRLSVDMPAQYVYFQREALGRVLRRKVSEPAAAGSGGPKTHPLRGEGRLVDLSFGGAAFLAQAPLEPKGFAQVQFQIHGQPVRIMMEVLSNQPTDGGILVRGRLRGQQVEGRSVLNNYLSREQIKRLREKQAFHFKPGETPSGVDA